MNTNRFVRASVLRSQGLNPNAILALRARARRAAADAAAATAAATSLRTGLEAVQAITNRGKSPNGTTRLIQRTVAEALA